MRTYVVMHGQGRLTCICSGVVVLATLKDVIVFLEGTVTNLAI